jgi:hypothetical protein
MTVPGCARLCEIQCGILDEIKCKFAISCEFPHGEAGVSRGIAARLRNGVALQGNTPLQ